VSDHFATSGGPTNEDVSHGLLLAVLMAAGGSVDLPQSAFETDAMGAVDGSFYAVEIVPLDSGSIRLQVVTRPAT
jgi:hypothetical protein